MLSGEPDYLQLWKELARTGRGRSPSSFSYFDNKEKAEAFDAASRQKNRGRQDILLDVVKRELKPEDTVIDIGAGTGRWSIPLAEIAAQVTAVEPARSMSDVLVRNADEAGVRDKITLVHETWETADVGIHDIVVSFHSMYMSADLAAFVRKMEAHASRCCYMGIRHFRIDGIIQELSAKVHGTRHDSTNFVIAYNALYQMGIYANVFMEDFRRSWTDPTLETAFARAKRHLHIEDETAYDDLVRDTLERRLTHEGSSYRWPDSMTTALVWWRPSQSTTELNQVTVQ